MRIIGLTGGIGSGKTSILREFSKFGIPCYESDLAAKNILDQNHKLIKEIEVNFGKNLFLNNRLVRDKLADIVFNDKNKMLLLNKIFEPYLSKDFKSYVSKQNFPLIIKEAAVLFELGSYKSCDYVILVTAPEDLRIKRVMKRDGLNKTEVLARIKNQWNDENKIPLADFVINNIEWKKTLIQIKKLKKILIN